MFAFCRCAPGTVMRSNNVSIKRIRIDNDGEGVVPQILIPGADKAHNFKSRLRPFLETKKSST